MRLAEARRQAALQRAALADARRRERQSKQEYLESRLGEVEDLNDELAARVRGLESILSDGLRRRWPLEMSSLKRPMDLPGFDAQGADQSAPEPNWEQFAPKPPSFVAKLLPGSSEKFVRTTELRQAQFGAAVEAWRKYEAERLAWLQDAHARHKAACERLQAEIEAQNAEVDVLAAAYRQGESDATIQYFSMVIERDDLPEDFPAASRIAFIPESRQLVVERDIPGPDTIPAEHSWKYVRARDAIESTARPATQSRSLYASVVAQVALRTLHGLFAADTATVVETIVLNCIVDRTNPATGKSERPCLLTVRTSREVLLEHDLSKVDPAACLKHLGAEVSTKPYEVAPVRPILDFNMVDPRFIDKPDVLSGLESRPNLAQLTPGEFEALITNLFEKMGLETRLTQASRDGGVDCVAWDMRPIVGGKVIVQAKRYKHTVGVSAVRDLYGTVMNEGAAKGILVTTSGYGRAAYDFGNNKPLQLITGGELLYLLDQHTGVKARIEFPEEWEDPTGFIEHGPPAKPPIPELEAASTNL